MALTLMAGGRRRKLFRLKKGGTLYVRFEFRGKVYKRTTGKTDETAAKERAKQIVEAVVNGDDIKSRALKLRSDYRRVSGTDQLLREIRDVRDLLLEIRDRIPRTEVLQ
jgi:hypothetical protein